MEVVWTDLAQDTLWETLNFVVNQWNEIVALKVRNSVYQDVTLLEQFPRLGTRYSLEGEDGFEVRFIVTDKRIKVFYLIYGGKIYIVAVWDVRREPVVLENMLSGYLKRWDE